MQKLCKTNFFFIETRLVFCVNSSHIDRVRHASLIIQPLKMFSAGGRYIIYLYLKLVSLCKTHLKGTFTN